MKKLLLTLSLSFLYFLSFSQGISILGANGSNLIGDTIFLDEFTDTTNLLQSIENKDFAIIINSSPDSMTIKLRRFEESVVPGTGDALCWGQTCYGEQRNRPVWEVEDTVRIAAGDTAGGLLGGFVTYHFPRKQIGESTYRYEFYDPNDRNVVSEFYVQYRTTKRAVLLDQTTLGSSLNNMDTVFLSGLVDTANLQQQIKFDKVVEIINNAANPLDLELTRFDYGGSNSVGDALCWADSCYDDLSAIPYTEIKNGANVPAGDSAGFSFILLPEGKTGTYTYQYEFVDKKKSSFPVSFFVKISTTIKPFDISISSSTNSSIVNDTVLIAEEIDTINTTSQLVNLANLTFNNTTADTLFLGLKRTRISNVNGSADSICWGGVCSGLLNQNVYQTSNTIKVAPGQSTTAFNSDFLPNGGIGVSIYEYEIFDVSNQNIVSSFSVKYDITFPVGLLNKQLNDSKFTIYPNPARNMVNLDFEKIDKLQNSQIVVMNLLGEKVVTLNIGSSNQLDVSKLESGIYFVGIMQNEGIIATKKLIVTH